MLVGKGSDKDGIQARAMALKLKDGHTLTDRHRQTDTDTHTMCLETWTALSCRDKGGVTRRLDAY